MPDINIRTNNRLLLLEIKNFMKETNNITLKF